MSGKARMFKPAKVGPSDNKKATPGKEQKGAPQSPQKPEEKREGQEQ